MNVPDNDKYTLANLHMYSPIRSQLSYLTAGVTQVK